MNSRLEVISLEGNDPQANLAFEEQLFDSLRDSPRPVCLFYFNNPSVILGRNNPEDLWVNRSACEADSVPILRRFSGGGTVYHDLDNLNFSFIAPKNELERQMGSALPGGPRGYIDFFRSVVIAALSRGGAGFSATGVSDVSLNGRKVSGNAQRIAGKLVLHHGTLLLRCPIEAIRRYLPLPPDRPTLPHERFVTGLIEEGYLHSAEQIKAWLAAAYSEALEPERPL